MNSYEYQKLRGIKRKLYLIELRGGCCEKCGYCKNISALDFHHKDPNDKESSLDMRHLSNSTMEKILTEFAKCKVLCANCHREEHHPELDKEFAQGITNVINESVISIKEHTKCINCCVKITNGYLRCKKCSYLNRRKILRPEILILQNEVKEYGATWCAKKYKISRTSIRRWLGQIK